MRRRSIQAADLSVARANECGCETTELTEIMAKHVFVGVVDLQKELSLVQYSTKLYLVGHGALGYVGASAPTHPCC